MDGIVDSAGEQAWSTVGVELRRLRIDQKVSLAGLARQVNYTKGYLSKIETGQKRLTPEMARRCDEVLQTGGVLVRLLARAGCLAPGDEEPDPAGTEVCPYPGLVAFGLPEARWFFGRDQAISEVLGRLDDRLAGGGPLVVVAPSGAGKSSLLAAGVIPALARGALPGSRGWPVVVTTPGAHPLATLAAQVAEQAGADPAAEVAASADPDRFAALLTSAVAAHAGKQGDTSSSARVVLIVDQFEETFTECQQEVERQAFITALGTAAHSGVVVVVLGVRADFYGHCLTYPELLSAVRAPVALGPMSPDQLRSIITGPAAAEGLQVEPGLVELLLRDLGVSHNPGTQTAGYDPGALPLLAHALRATWQQRTGHLLTVAGYQRTGGIRGAIATTAEHVYKRLSPPEQHIAQQILLRLVQVDTHTEALRHRIPRNRLLQALPAPTQATSKVLETFARARLLTFDTDNVEITHEALLRAWPRLTDWISTDRAGLRTHQLLSEATEAWEADNRDPSLLYRGSRLAIAHDWATDPGRKAQLSALEQAYLDASINQKHHEKHAEQRRTRRLHALVGVLVISLVVTLLAGGIAFQQYHEADRQSRLARATQLTATSQSVAATHPDAAMLLAVEAYHLQEEPGTLGALLSAQSQYFTGQLTGHTATITKVAFNPDGHTLATASDDRTVRLWDLASHHQITTLDGPGPIHDAEFSPDGRILVTAGAAGTAQLWDVSDPLHPSPLAPLPGVPGITLSSAGFSHDGRILVTAGADGTARLWDMTSRRQITTLTGLITTVVFSPDDRVLATASADGTARLWNVADLTHPAPLGPPLTGNTGFVNAVVFSPDGHTLATANANSTARLWEVRDPRHPMPLGPALTGHSSNVTAIVFSPDGRTLVTGSGDGTARLWDIATHQTVGIFRGHTGSIISVAFSPDGHTVATAGDDHIVRLWNTSGPILISSPPAISHDVEFNPDRRILATTSANGVLLWDLTNHHQITTLTSQTGTLTKVAFSPDGHTLATANADGTARLWNMTDPTHPTPLGPPLTGHTSNVTTMVFSPTGHTLATANADGTARLWNMTDPTHPTPLGPPLTGHTSPVYAMAFNENGHILATASDDGTVRRWEADTGRLITTLTITTPLPGERFFPLAFSSDGHTLATTSGDDTTTKLWDVDSQQPIATLTGHTGLINAAAFSRDGGLLATISDDATVRLWDLNPDRVTTHLCHIIGTVNQAEWNRFLPNLPYQTPCP